jgi:DNA-binding beta-propeller fold protein YncE
MPHEQSAVQGAALQGGEAHHAEHPPRAGAAYGGFDEDEEWLEDPAELPPRPRRRLLGAGGNPLALALLGVLLIACGFIGGVLVEKGETPSPSSTAGATAGLASRFAALRGAGTTGATRSSSTGGAGGFFGAGTGSAGRPTAGTVAYLDGSTLYVTNSEGNTIKVKTSPATSVNKTVTSSVKGIHPGETVTITGSTGSNGAVSAESISVGSSGGGLAALFGGSKSRAGSTSSSGGETPALFGG